MRKVIIGALLIVAAGAAWIGNAQQRKKPPTVKHSGKAYLAGGTRGSGTISKREFDSLVALPLVASDTALQMHPVTQFTFTYAERGVFEDSTGKLRIMTDYFSIESYLGKVPSDWLNMLKDRVKAGDTAYFRDIQSVYPDKKRTPFFAEPIKLILTD